MRLGIVRNDIRKVYLQDVENSSQRDASLESAGQSRYFRKPTDAELQSVLNEYASLTVRGANTAANVDTTVANGTKLNVRTSASAAFTQVLVTSNAALAKSQIVTELNNGFTTAGLPLIARLSGTNQITLDTTTKGANAYIEISAASPSAGALHTVVGLTAAATSPLSVASLKTAAYPTGTTIDVSTATLAALSTFSLMLAPAQSALITAIADTIAPKLSETGPVLLSFAFGTISKLISATFQPGGARIGLPAGVAAQALADDGVTSFTL